MPAHIKLSSLKEREVDDSAYRKTKGKYKEEENNFDDTDIQTNTYHKNRLATLDIFAGCGGLSEGLEQAGNLFWFSLAAWPILSLLSAQLVTNLCLLLIPIGVSLTKWAIEYEEPAGEAFNLNHPETLMFINNCNVILR